MGSLAAPPRNDQSFHHVKRIYSHHSLEHDLQDPRLIHDDVNLIVLIKRFYLWLIENSYSDVLAKKYSISKFF